MNGILISESDKISIIIYVAVGKDKTTYADVDKCVVLKEAQVPEEVIEKHTIVFRRPSYKDEVSILQGILQSDVVAENSSFRFDIALLSYNKFVSLLESWSFKDEGGDPLPATQTNIDSLNPAIARAITSELNNLT